MKIKIKEVKRGFKIVKVARPVPPPIEEERRISTAPRIPYVLGFDVSQPRKPAPADLASLRGFREAWGTSCGRPDIFLNNDRSCDLCPHYAVCWYHNKRLKNSTEYWKKNKKVKVHLIAPPIREKGRGVTIIRPNNGKPVQKPKVKILIAKFKKKPKVILIKRR